MPKDEEPMITAGIVSSELSEYDYTFLNDEGKPITEGTPWVQTLPQTLAAVCRNEEGDTMSIVISYVSKHHVATPAQAAEAEGRPFEGGVGEEHTVGPSSLEETRDMEAHPAPQGTFAFDDGVGDTHQPRDTD